MEACHASPSQGSTRVSKHVLTLKLLLGDITGDNIHDVVILDTGYLIYCGHEAGFPTNIAWGSDNADFSEVLTLPKPGPSWNGKLCDVFWSCDGLCTRRF